MRRTGRHKIRFSSHASDTHALLPQHGAPSMGARDGIVLIDHTGRHDINRIQDGTRPMAERVGDLRFC
jgi:hypothetical protein